MKKFFLFVLMLLVIPNIVNADSMYNVDMDIYIDEYGTANITEVWDVKADSGTEWYKTLYDLGNSELSNYEVYMDDNKLVYKDYWNVSGSLSSKAGYYGINNTSDEIELCFGKTDMKRHKFIIKYTLSNYIFNTSDSQVLYWTLLPNVTVDNFTVDITSYYLFPDTLDVWGYGYKGYAYVNDGKISMSNEGNLNNEYVTLLVKFPSGTFNTLNSYSQYENFDTVLDKAEEDTFEYDYYEESFIDKIMDVVMGFVTFIIPVIISIISIKYMVDNGYGYVNNKKIDKKNVSMFRDIPCNKDIYYANTLIKLNNFGYKESNILGAIILKWVRNDKISFRNEKTGLFNKDTSVIDLTKDVTFDNKLETELFDMMRAASKDGILEAKELERWSSNNYSKFLGLFKRIENDGIGSLKEANHIYHRTSKEECKKKNVMDDMIYDDSVKLYGLKKYLEEFSNMDSKEVMEVKLWDEYLMFAYLFGIADKVAKQMKDMYPEIVTQMNENNFDYDTIMFVNHISMRSVNAASSARAAAESYSSGGGGFSSGGGGGGSFGGGGSMGGR